MKHSPSDADAGKVVYVAPDGQPLPGISRTTWISTWVAAYAVLALGFVMLMAGIGGFFVLLSWPLRAWLDIPWLSAFGVVSVLFFAAGGVLVFVRMGSALDEIRHSTETTRDFIDALESREDEMTRRGAASAPLRMTDFRIVPPPSKKRPRRSPKPGKGEHDVP